MQLSLKNGLSVLFILLAAHGFGQTQKINQYDQNGKRDGVWKKQYENSAQLRYQGQFEHGQEVGTFKFYKPHSGDQPFATRTYKPGTDTVVMRYFSKKGILLSQGKMLHKKRTGTWNYFSKDGEKRLIMTEPYNNGKLNGWKITYYPNGKVMEKQLYKNGMKNGAYYLYRKQGGYRLETHFKNDTLDGHCRVFDKKGVLQSKGNYVDGWPKGVWKFYKDGKLEMSRVYPLVDHGKNEIKLPKRLREKIHQN